MKCENGTETRASQLLGMLQYRAATAAAAALLEPWWDSGAPLHYSHAYVAIRSPHKRFEP